jgi:hypothetical protein
VHLASRSKVRATDDVASIPGESFEPSGIDRLLLLVVVAAGVLRFWRLGAQSLWFDEYVTAQDVSGGLGSLISAIRHAEGSPPLYFILEWASTRVLGRGDEALRVLSALAGTATVPAVYAVARELKQTRRVARVAALLVAVSPMLVWYSQDARPYALLVFLASVSLLFCARAVDEPRTSDLLLWGVTSAAAMSTHYFAVFIVFGEAVWLGVALRPRWRRLALGYAPVAVVAGPLLALALSQRSEKQAWIHGWPVRTRLAEGVREFLLGPGDPDDRLTWLAAALVAVAVGIVVARASRRERVAAAIMAAVGAVAVLAPLAVTLIGVDYFIGHNVMTALIPFTLAVGVGLGTRRAGWLGAGAVVVLSLTCAGVVVNVSNNPALQKADWRSVARLLRSHDPASVILVPSLNTPITRYLTGSRVIGQGELLRVREVDVISEVPAPARRCGRFSGQACELLLFPFFPKNLASQFVVHDKTMLDGFTVFRYQAERLVEGRAAEYTPVNSALGTVVKDKTLLHGVLIRPRQG